MARVFSNFSQNPSETGNKAKVQLQKKKKKKNRYIYIYIVIHPHNGIPHSSEKEQAAASLMNRRAHVERKKSEEAR